MGINALELIQLIKLFSKKGMQFSITYILIQINMTTIVTVAKLMQISKANIANSVIGV